MTGSRLFRGTIVGMHIPRNGRVFARLRCNSGILSSASAPVARKTEITPIPARMFDLNGLQSGNIWCASKAVSSTGLSVMLDKTTKYGEYILIERHDIDRDDSRYEQQRHRKPAI